MYLLVFCELVGDWTMRPSLFVEAVDCTEMLPNIPCNVDPPSLMKQCTSTCKSRHGHKAFGDCIKIHENDSPFCICNFCRTN